MKNLNTISKKTLGSICAVCALSILLSSCLKDHNTIPVGPPTALVTFIQASPDEPALDFYLDNNRVNVNPINYGDGINYFNAYSGKRVVNFYNQGTTTKILSDSIHVDANKAYTLFLANTPAHPEVVLLTDTLNMVAGNNANVRFVNLSPDAPAVDLAITGGSTISTNKAYKGYSAFTPVPGGKSYSIEVRQAGTSTVLATMTGVNLNSGNVYTIYLRGLVAGTTTGDKGDKLSIGFITNAFY
jgi:hypothetical protein